MGEQFQQGDGDAGESRRCEFVGPEGTGKVAAQDKRREAEEREEQSGTIRIALRMDQPRSLLVLNGLERAVEEAVEQLIR